MLMKLRFLFTLYSYRMSAFYPSTRANCIPVPGVSLALFTGGESCHSTSERNYGKSSVARVGSSARTSQKEFKLVLLYISTVYVNVD